MQRRYLNWFLLALLAPLASVAVFDAVVDPLGIYNLTRIPGWNASKVEVDEKLRTHKAVAITKGAYDTLILGNSRVLIGLNPASRALKGHRAYNFGVPIATMGELRRILEYTLARQRIDSLLLGIDIDMLFSRVESHRDFSDSALADGNPFFRHLRLLLGWDTLKSSFKTVALNMEGRESLITPLGFMDGEKSWGKRLAQGASAHDYFNRSLSQAIFQYSKRQPGELVVRPAVVEEFNRMLATALNNGVAVHVFINPVHALHNEVVLMHGHARAHEDGLRAVVAAVEEARSANRGKGAHLCMWDFRGYNSVTTEPVPPASEAGVPMRWYWESSHYNENAGDLIVETLRGVASDARQAHRDFGVSLTGKNLESHLQVLWADHGKYARENQSVITEIKRLAEEKEYLRFR